MTAHGVSHTHIRQNGFNMIHSYFTHIRINPFTIFGWASEWVIFAYRSLKISCERNLYRVNKGNDHHCRQTAFPFLFLQKRILNNFFSSSFAAPSFVLCMRMLFFILISLYHFLFDSNHVIKFFNGEQREKNSAMETFICLCAKQRYITTLLKTYTSYSK